MRAGVNRFVWDLRYSGAKRLRGNKTGEEADRGPLVLPGTYQSAPAVWLSRARIPVHCARTISTASKNKRFRTSPAGRTCANFEVDERSHDRPRHWTTCANSSVSFLPCATRFRTAYEGCAAHPGYRRTRSNIGVRVFPGTEDTMRLVEAGEVLHEDARGGRIRPDPAGRAHRHRSACITGSA